MPSHVVDKVLAEPRHQAQGFHVGPERVVVLRREEGGAGIVTVLPDQRECFRQQLDASEAVGLLSPVFQPEAALVIPEEVLKELCHNSSWFWRSISAWSRCGKLFI